MNTHQVKGRFRQAAGKVKQMAGGLFGNRRLKTKGRAQQAGGKIQSTYGDAADSAKKHS